MRIDLYSHGFKVSDLIQTDLNLIAEHCRPLVKWEFVKQGKSWIKEAKETYAAALKNRREFRFHINTWPQFQVLLKMYNYPEGNLQIIHHAHGKEQFTQAHFKVKNMKEPWKNQPKIIEYVISDDKPNKMVTLQPGGGKTFISQYCAWKIGLRTSVTMKGGYVQRWVDDLEETFDFARGQLLVIRGGNALAGLMEMALAGELEAQYMLFTLGTWDMYLKDYEASNGKSAQYPIAPGELFAKLGVGFAVNDEVHQMFHQVFRQHLYMNVYKSLGLSGTMTSSDDFSNRVYDIAYPVQERNDGGGFDAFIQCTAMFYQLQNPKAVRFKGPQGGYSHNAFEESLMSKKDYFPNYLKLISFVVNNRYIKVREPGQKMLIFCASIKLCTLLVDRLEREHPDLVVKRYCQDDPYDNLLEADISVSTILSAGTAVDIPNLRISFCTTAINSRQSNEQALGRTRRLKEWPDVVPEFCYLTCSSIDKHVEYHRNKKEFFAGKVKDHAEVQLPITV